ncbi:FtsX-like permease family protein [Plantactinospora siamensis]|uniref:FtsX-like permease family protein n=1 Tax=Plantactinospora siamensis TaxID=555372 RepID=A0ABV6NYM5_9ACTN
MAAWWVTVRGIAYRPGRSLVVALLIAVTTATAVAIPAYTRAAQQSVLTDVLTAQPPVLAGLLTRSGDTDQDAALAASQRAVAGSPVLARRLGYPQAAVYLEMVVPDRRESTQLPLAWRGDACAHLRLVAGACPSRAREVVLADRSAKFLGVSVGQRVPLQERIQSAVGFLKPRPAEPFTVTGIYDPNATTRDPYWGRGFYFGKGYNEKTDIYSLDSAFVATTAGMFDRTWRPTVTVEYPLRAGDVRLSDIPALRAGLGEVDQQVRPNGMVIESGLPQFLDEAKRQHRAIARSVPLVALPLVVLCLFVLFVVAAAVTEERSPEIALARLRGLRPLQLGGFGNGELLLLVLLATPVGLGLGLASTELAARAFLARSAAAEPTMAVLLAAVAALLGAAVAIVLAGRRTLRTGVLALLRRVPSRSRRRAVAIEAALGALALAALYQVLAARDRSSPIAYAAPALVALVAGLLAGRLLGWWARARSRRGAARGRLATMLSAAQLARRPGTVRVAALLTVAVALLTFAATSWDVAAGNRETAARAEVGAPRVYQVNATDPAALLTAVRAADPTGRRAMAVVRRVQFYGEGDTVLLGVDAARLPGIAQWPGGNARTPAAVAGRLHTDTAPTVRLHGPRVTLDATVAARQAAKPMSLGLVLDSGAGPRMLDLGDLVPGRHSYAAELTGCPAGCRLLALTVRRFPGNTASIRAQLTVDAIRDGRGPVEARLGEQPAWRPAPAAQQGEQLTVAPGRAGLEISVTSTAPGDPVIEYADTPPELPVVLAGSAPADDGGTGAFDFAALGTAPDPWRVTDRFAALPGGGDQAMLYDLETELRQAGRTGYSDSPVEYQVWAAGPEDPALPARLSAGGVQVTAVHTLAARRVELGRLAPALALRLYLAAGAVAVLLAIGTLLLTASVGIRARIRELTALRTVGVPRAVLRRAVRAEYASLFGAAVLIGVPAGLAGAALLLPAIPLVSIDADALRPVYRLAGLWLPGALAVLACCLAATALAAPRVVRRAEPRGAR